MANNTQSLPGLIFKIIGIIGGIIYLIGALFLGEGDAGRFVIFSILFSPLGIFSFISFVVGYFIQKSHETAENTKRMASNTEIKLEDTKKCLDCAELVKKEAKKCRFCGYKFDSREVN